MFKLLVFLLAIYAVRRLLWYNTENWEQHDPENSLNAYRVQIVFFVTTGGFCAFAGGLAFLWDVLFSGAAFAGFSPTHNQLAKFSHVCGIAGILSFALAGRAVSKISRKVALVRAKRLRESLIRTNGARSEDADGLQQGGAHKSPNGHTHKSNDEENKD